MGEALLALAVVAVTELVSRVREGDWRGAGTIVIAVVVGGAAGFFNIGDIESVVVGIELGLAAVGVHTVARQVG